MIITEENYRELIALHVRDSMTKINTTPLGNEMMDKFISDLQSVKFDKTFKVTGNDVQNTAETMVRDYLKIVKGMYETEYQNSNRLQKLLLARYFRDYRKIINEFEAAIEKLFPSNNKRYLKSQTCFKIIPTINNFGLYRLGFAW